mgnify:FL=1
MKIVVGLGNPGSGYAQSRHNVGFQCIDELSKKCAIPIKDKNRHVILGHGLVDGKEILIVKPRTFMNRSGEAISYLLTRFQVSTQDLLVIYDDMNLPTGKIRIRHSGSSGGHNGIQSIISTINSHEIQRVRIGIGRPPEGVGDIEYVLGKFTADEKKLIEEAVTNTQTAVRNFLSNGLEWTMSHYN